ncbi:MAG TPA: hypothetical protein VFV39_01890 [Limnobacter sp.]|nr:hypothetical protein [Limnobacter sp.]
MAEVPATGTSSWQEPARYVPDEDAIEDMFEAAGRGDWAGVTTLASGLRLGWMSHEMKRLAEVGKHYGALERTASLLENALNAHTSDGKFQAGTSIEVQNYLDIAVQSMRNANKPVGDDILNIIKKLKAGESISVSEAKNLQKFILDSRELVVPKKYSSEVLSAQVKSIRDQYDRELAGYREDIRSA